MEGNSFEAACEQVKRLAQDFDSNKGYYLSPEYQESEVRKDFIDKFLIALGWDVNHETQKNPFQQEVKVERGVAAGQSQRRADYAFYVAPNFSDPRIFVEAKKPFADLCAADNCFQTIRYGWNANVPIAVLTDFEEIAVLDCRYKPDIDTAALAVIERYHYSQYGNTDKFKRIFYLFSRDEVARGALDRFAQTLPKRRGKAVQRGLFKGGWQLVDESFLEELDTYREALAKNFKSHNFELNGETLTEVTQRTLDRLVFLRFLEDKLIEPRNYVSEFGKKGNPWREFIALCRRLDNVYNGIVFKKHDILDKPTLKVDESQFADICEELAHVNSPYDFNSIPIHILGSIYERFLGKVIVVTDKRAQVQEKPEVRKAGGVYYTPDYIVRYMVDNTVGRLIAGKTPSKIAEMRFADIACGSGSFLLAIYDLLLRYHRGWYNERPSKANKDGCIKHDDGCWHLSLKQRRRILLNNIYGVDIDNQAVEVAQLSLYLKLLEEETTASARYYQLEFKETILPPLNKNIVCGNSLIGTDILNGQLFRAEEERKINPMNFEDTFPEVMKRGGFDAVIGNPPYIFTRETIAVRERRYYSEKYTLSWEKQNTFMLFMERLLQVIGPTGVGSYIVPNSWLTIESAKLLRERYLLHLRRVIDLNYPVFQGVSMEPSIFVLGPTESDAPVELARIKTAEQLASTTYILANRSRLQKHNRIVFHESDSLSDLIERLLMTTKPLGELFDVRTGLQAYEKGKGNPRQTAEDVRNHIFDRKHRENKHSIPYLEGRDVERYGIHWSGMWMQYGPWLSQPREIGIFTRPRILLREITGHQPYCLHHSYVEKQFLNNKSILNVLDWDDDRVRLKALVGVLNSKLMSFFYKSQAVKSGRNIFPKVVVKDLGHFPVPNTLVTKNVSELAQKVEAMLEAKKQMVRAQTDKDKTYYENKCATLDRQIDQLVYDLYGLSEDEIKIAEIVTNESRESCDD